MIQNTHESVMVDEVLFGLKLSPLSGLSQSLKDKAQKGIAQVGIPRENFEQKDSAHEGIYLDLTFGRGGHSLAILKHLSKTARLYAMDKDQAAKPFAQSLEKRDARFKFQNQTFSKLQAFCESFGIVGKVNGLVMDLGVSSPQLDEGQRGFSFKNPGPLDMRMDQTQGISAAEWINTANESDIQFVLKEYGEERFYKRIARGIIEARNLHAIATTQELADIVTRANPAWEKHKHPATRSFQAIRIFINRELEELTSCLEQTLSVLAPQGRLVVMSFHSLEDRRVKQFIQKNERDFHPRHLPLETKTLHPKLRKVGKKLKPSLQEIARNPRARSAVLRIAEKMDEKGNST